MKAEVRDQIVTFLASEMEAYGDNLDALEGQLLSSLREVGQGALEAVTAAKRGVHRQPDHVRMRAKSEVRRLSLQDGRDVDRRLSGASGVLPLRRMW